MKQKSVNTFFSLGGSTDSSSASKRREEWEPRQTILPTRRII
jgi:hypothetical protein